MKQCCDCLEMYDDNEKFTKGMCKRCYIRRWNFTTRHKHDKKVYVPLKDLTEEEINKLPGRKSQVPKKEIKPDANKTKYYGMVCTDVNKAFEKAGLTQNYLSLNLLDIIENLWILCQEDNLILEAKQGEKIFNSISDLYRHSLEKVSWDNTDKIIELAGAQKALQELRRPTKEILDFYISIDKLVDYMKKDPNLMSLLEESRTALKRKAEYHKDPNYFTNIESEVVNDETIIFNPEKDSKYKIYDCTVWCYNLCGDPNRRLFRANNGIYAKSKEDAKLKLKTFLKEKFASVTYKDIDISIREVSSVEEINKLAKEGL